MREMKLFEINQPVGTFYIGKINARDLLKVFEIKRISDGEGCQRDVNIRKVSRIEDFCIEDPRATFPTPIIVSICSDNITLDEGPSIFTLKYDESNVKFKVIDGQHRLLGIQKANVDFELPIVIMFDVTPEDEAYIFTAINKNQTKVDKSVIYSLFELNEERSPIKTCHDIAVIMNESKDSPFYKRIKMLGKKKSASESLSQAAFIDNLLPFFSDGNKSTKKETIFEEYYAEEKDAVIVKILKNYFTAASTVFNDEWNSSSSNLMKTTGYGGLCKALPDLFLLGKNEKDLSEEFFVTQFKKVKAYFSEHHIYFTSSQYGSGEAAQKSLSDAIKKGYSV